MSLRRRDKSPPFEIMGSAPPTPPMRPLPSRPSRGGSVGSSAGDTDADHRVEAGWSAEPGQGAWTRWWASANAPLVLRMPRGYAVLLVIGVLGLTMLAYWAGDSRGHGRAVERLAAESDASAPDRPSRRAPEDLALLGLAESGDGGRTANGSGREAGHGGVERAGTLQDPRIPGMNYLILARYPADEAVRLIRFLRGRGVEAFGVPADNPDRYFVIAPRAFGSGEWNGRAGQDYLATMRQHGNAWKQHNRGGDDLHTMYYSLYRPRS